MTIKLDWDHYSDQPAIIKNRKLKRKIYLQSAFDFIKILFINIPIYPLCFIHYLLRSKKNVNANPTDFFGLGINMEKSPESTLKLIDDLGVDSLLIRLPLADIKNLPSYVAFAEQYRNKNLLINILQDRRHVEDLALLKESLDKIFTAFSGIASSFQLGNAINRKKWAFFSMDEYLRYYRVGYELRNQKHPELELLGSSVIDFEYYFSIRTLFNFYNIKFDRFSSLLYVDRRGAPENTQMGLDLIKKLHLMQAILHLSPKSTRKIAITETNWPLTGTYPYAPTSEDDCVALDEQANYLMRYYILALASGVVSHVYWHQLMAPGYGLIDNRSDEIVYHPSYRAFKTMISYLKSTKFSKLEQQAGIYCAHFCKTGSGETIRLLWKGPKRENGKITIDKQRQTAFSRDGRLIDKANIEITGSPLYLFTKNCDL